MPKIIVEIEYDQPDDPYWMNPDNVAICLNAHCGNSDFKVKWAENGDPWRRREGHKALRVKDGELEFFDPHPSDCDIADTPFKLTRPK